MKHHLSLEDLEFKKQVEACTYPVASFNHRAHLRLAYIYLCEQGSDKAVITMRDTLLGLLKSAGIDPAAKFHETLTKSWILAVEHFMVQTEASESADHFIGQNTVMMDSKVMMSHYSAEVLFSEKARGEFVEPNLDPIPRYDKKTT